MLNLNHITAPFPLFYVPKHFKIEELVSKRIHAKLEQDGLLERCWTLFDVRLLLTIDALRETYGERIIINDWHLGGSLNQCGLRMEDSTVGAEFSQHKFGRAADLHFEKTPSDKVRADCLKEPWKECFRFITCFEAGVSWFHFDTRNWDKEASGILVVNP